MEREEPKPPQPFIAKEERPDLTVDLDRKVGDLTVRDLATLLGEGALAKSKEALKEKDDINEKFALKDIAKEQKDRKDQKEHKEHKDPKDHKDQKDQKDSKDQKDPKEQKDTKDHKDPKEQKDTKDHKDPKEHKDQKDHKDHKEAKEGIIEKANQAEKLDTKSTSEGANPTGAQGGGLQDLIRRVSGLEAEVRTLQGRPQGSGG